MVVTAWFGVFVSQWLVWEVAVMLVLGHSAVVWISCCVLFIFVGFGFAGCLFELWFVGYLLSWLVLWAVCLLIVL